MPAELTYTDGTADFFEVGTQRSAWHREGHLIPPGRDLTIPDALELIHADYEVVRQPTFYETGALGEELRPSQRAFVTVRTDTDTELSSVGRSYTVLQNEDAFRAVEPLLDQGVVGLETGGVLRSGADIWLLGRFDTDRFSPVVREVFADEVVPHCLFSNNHSGRRAELWPVRGGAYRDREPARRKSSRAQAERPREPAAVHARLALPRDVEGRRSDPASLAALKL